MLEKMQDIRLFCKLNTSRSKKNDIITAQEVDLLSRLALSTRSLSPSELSASMDLTKSIISRLVEQLEHRSYIQKEFNKNDRRSYQLSITEAGRNILTQTYREYLSPIYHLHQKIGDKDFETLTRLIRKVNHIIQE